MKLEASSFFDTINRNIKKGKSFTFTGLTTFSRLLLLKYIRKLSNKKILFITSTEQSALRYSADLERIFDLESVTLRYQNVSPYDGVNSNLYDYQKQISVLLNQPEIVIAPVKSLLEKFPKDSFFDINSFSLKINDSIDQRELLKHLVNLGYKRSTMVSDIGEFSIRGDIADIYTLEEYPIRIEFWGDEIVDIRYFDNETQKSVSKGTKANIKPIYKFVIPEKLPKEISSCIIYTDTNKFRHGDWRPRRQE
jgi:transcription-repair coupling factor (superfamily II helicase)